MKKSRPNRTHLSLMISVALFSCVANAQDEPPPPTLYTTVQEKEIYIIQPNGEQTDVATGETVVVNNDGLEFVTRAPDFLEWPCGSSFAAGRGGMESFSLDSLDPDNQIAQIIDLYFNNQQIIEPNPSWLAGESHGSFSAAEIDQYVSDAYWYQAGPADAVAASLRPPTLLISMFYGTGQVVVDNNHLDDLKAMYGDEPIPVVFQYQEENVVPVSYFGDNATPAQIMKAYQESGIKPADPPLWYAGDSHSNAGPGALADSLGVPPASDMSASRMAKLKEDIAENGFSGKPVTLALVAAGSGMIADEGDRLRAAQDAGITQVPIMFSVYDVNSVSSMCGLAPPVAAAGVLGTAEGEAPGATPPDETTPGTTPGEPGGPDGPIIPRPLPPEIELPDPPQPVLPDSDS